MTEAELRARFDQDKEIRAPERELLWEWLVKEHYVSEVCLGVSGWEEFKAWAIELAGRQWEILGRKKPPGRSEKLPFDEITLTDLERQHAEVLSPYLAKRAALLPEVRSFREEKLGGGTLEPEQEQVTAFLRSELRHLPSEDYAYLEWALEQIPSYSDADEVEELKDLVGGCLNRGLESERRYLHENIRRAIEFDSMAMSYEPSEQALQGLMHLIRDETGRTLEDVSRWLTSRYPWPLRDAAWFVLTDEPPEVEPLEIKYDNVRGTYRLTFAPWITEKTIRCAFRSVHDGDNRPLGSKSLSAFRFVCERTELGHTPKWAELTRHWNEQHPDDMFTDRSALRRAYERAEKRLAFPWVNEQGYTAGSDL